MRRPNHSALLLALVLASNTPIHAAMPENCKSKLAILLEGSKARLEKDQDQLDQIIFQLQSLKQQNGCSIADKALTSIFLADAIWIKYLMNAWVINERTNLLNESPSDMNQWSTNLYVETVMRELQSSLSSAQNLELLTIADFSRFVSNTKSDPTLSLLEIVSKKALDMTEAIRSNGAANSKLEEIPENEKLFLSPELFIKERFESNQSSIVAFQLAIWQNLLKRAITLGDDKKLVSLELERLERMKSLTNWNEDSEKKYQIAIESLYARFQKSPFSVQIAEQYVTSKLQDQTGAPENETPQYSDWSNAKYAELIRFMNDLLTQNPKADKACELGNLRNSMEMRSLQCAVKSIVYPNRPITLSLRYRNLSSVKLVLKDHTGTIVWSSEATLKSETPYSEVNTELEIPGQPFGEYSLSIVQKGSNEVKNTLSFIVTALFITYQRVADHDAHFLVLDSETGKPVEGAKISITRNSRQLKDSITTLLSDRQGMVQYANFAINESFNYQVSLRNDKYGKPASQYTYVQPKEGSLETINFFTDRVRYRPGQEVQFKGIAWMGNSDGSRAVANLKIDVDLINQQGERLATQQLTTDPFGAIAGVFQLPNKGLNGTYTLQTNRGGYSFEVAEYKRPSFRVLFDTPTQEYAFGDSIEVKAKVATYSGVALPGSSVAYTIYRTSSPFWRRGFFNEQIDSGTTTTDQSGDFKLAFLAAPDSGNSWYTNYRVEATVTNASGETQMEIVELPIGKTSLILSIDLLNTENLNTESYQYQILNKRDRSAVVVNTVNLNGQKVERDGELALYRTERTSAESEPKRGALVATYPYQSGKENRLNLEKVASGSYLLVARTNDSKGREAIQELPIVIYAPDDKALPIAVRKWFVQQTTSCEVGESATFLLGSSLKDVSVICQVFSNGKLQKTINFELSEQFKQYHIPYLKEYGKEMTIVALFVRNGELYQHEMIVQRKEPSKKLDIRTEIFRDKLLPGATEEWSFKILDSEGKPVSAQVVVGMYDASLDQFGVNNWVFNPLYRSFVNVPSWSYVSNYSSNDYAQWYKSIPCGERIDPAIISFFGYDTRMALYGRADLMLNSAPSMRKGLVEEVPSPMLSKAMESAEQSVGKPTTLPQSVYRSNLQETAFFYPKMETDEKGEVRIKFTIPEALTEWNLMMLANTPTMLWGELNRKVVTSKPFMVMPNLPRFVRHGDKISISTQLINKSDARQSGVATLEILDPLHANRTIAKQELSFDMPTEENHTLHFDFETPTNLDLLVVRIVAGNKMFSDGEQHYLPVLPSRTLITESMTMNIRGNSHKTFSFDSFINNHSTTLSNHAYTVEFTGNPAWYVVQSLPAITQLEPSNTTNAMALYYVNTLATHIANEDTGIKRAISYWKGEGNDEKSLLSQLETDPALKQILIEESPWVLQAAEQRKNLRSLMQLFEEDLQTKTRTQALDALSALQGADGGFGWYKGSHSTLFETLNLLEGFARLIDLGAVTYGEVEKTMQIDALRFTDEEIVKRYNQKLKDMKRDQISPSWDELLWVYVRSSYRDIPFSEGALAVHKVYLQQMRANALKGSLYEMGISALALRRYGFSKEADKLVQKLRSLMTQSDELGRYWANNRSSYFFSVSAIQCHVLMMAALKEHGATEQELDEMKLWLLKQKQTQAWGTTPATIEASYGILMGGTNWLQSTTLPMVKVAGSTLHTNSWFAMADTVYVGTEITKGLAKIEITQSENHPAWAAAYWQYFENFDAVAQHGKELKIEKKLYKVMTQPTGEVIEPIVGEIKPGDIVVARLVVTADRDYGYVTLKDQRAACFEPVTQLSSYFYNQGVGYFWETKDATTNLFFDYLPKGSYVFEYRLKTTQRGLFNDGISSIQCLYAPEFVGNTQGAMVEVR